MSRLSSNLVPSMAEYRSHKGYFGAISLSLNGNAAAAFLCGATSPLVIGLVGELYVGELLLIQFAFLLLLSIGARPLLKLSGLGVFIQTAVLMLVGYFIADIYRDAHPAQFLRGWAKIILVTLDFAALAIICAHDKRALWWFVAGMAVGGLCNSALLEVQIWTVGGWKTGYSFPLAILMACLCGIGPIWLAACGFLLLGLVNFFMDFRILGAVCIFVAAVLWLRSSNAPTLSWRRMAQGFLAVALAIGISYAALLFTQDEFSARREQSNVGRSAGLSVAVRAIGESPLIGYGSWPMDARLVDLYRQQFAASGGKTEGRFRVNAFVAHSQILQGWVEGGVLGALFWLYYGYWLLRAIWYVALRRQADAYQPVFLFLLTYDLWHLFMSSFAGSLRFLIAAGIAIICICAGEMRDARKMKCPTT